MRRRFGGGRRNAFGATFRGVFRSCMLLVAAAVWGCGNEAPAPQAGQAASKPRVRGEEEEPQPESRGEPVKKRFQPLQLTAEGAATASKPASEAASAEKRSQSIVAALQPFQVLLGQWRWITRKSFGDFPKSAEDLEWVWDFQTDAGQPALTARSESNPYFTQLWLTYLPDEDRFQATAKLPEGATRVLRGTWTDGGEPREESDGKKLQHTFKLQVAQASPADGEQWQLTFTQLDNNQYLLDLARRPASGRQFGPLDTVRQQRLGTSFAVADSDNPGPKCIISGGLGTIPVSYKGKSYMVCCSGCAAAFNDDPERWLAKLAEREKAKKDE